MKIFSTAAFVLKSFIATIHSSCISRNESLMKLFLIFSIASITVQGAIVDINNELEKANKGRQTNFLKNVRNGKFLETRQCLELGVDIDAVNNYGENALHYSVIWDHVEITKLLLRNGANIEAVNNYGENALHQSAIRGYTEIARLLIENGANIEVKDRYGRTALHHSAIYGYTEIARLLIENGANIEVKGIYGLTALALAKRNQRSEIVQLLQDHTKRTGM